MEKLVNLFQGAKASLKNRFFQGARRASKFVRGLDAPEPCAPARRGRAPRPLPPVPRREPQQSLRREASSEMRSKTFSIA
jgi:hypothetical protein